MPGPRTVGPPPPPTPAQKGVPMTTTPIHFHRVGQRPICPTVLDAGQHTPDWSASQTTDLYVPGPYVDTAVSVGLTRCRTCGHALLLISTDPGLAAAVQTLELCGADTTHPGGLPALPPPTCDGYRA